MIARELIKKIRKIEIYTTRLVNDQLAGSYQSVFKGRGMAFDEVRQYQPGDDIRLIDWNVSARMNDVYVKRFVEEREMTVMLLVDMSASSLFGTSQQIKREMAAEMAAVVAFSAIKNNDRVGLFIFTDEVAHFVPPKKGRTHVLRVIRDILEFNAPASPNTATGIPEAVKYLMNITKKRSVAILLSDFFISPPEMPGVQRALSVAAQRHDFVAYVTRDQADETLPTGGLVTLEDLEGGGLYLVDSSSRSVQRKFRRAALEDRANVETLLKRLSIDYEVIWTEQDYIPAVNRLFSRRARRF